MATVSLLTGPASEPVSLADMKTHLRIDGEDQDAEITALIRAARFEVETFTGLRLISQTVQMTADAFGPGPMQLPVWPIISVDEVAYTDSAGEEQTLDAALWTLVRSRRPHLLAPAYGCTWPSTRSDYDAVRITITCGYGADAADVPDDIVRALMMIASERDAARGDHVVGSIVSPIPNGARAALFPHVFIC